MPWFQIYVVGAAHNRNLANRASPVAGHRSGVPSVAGPLWIFPIGTIVSAHKVSNILTAEFILCIGLTVCSDFLIRRCSSLEGSCKHSRVVGRPNSYVARLTIPILSRPSPVVSSPVLQMSRLGGVAEARPALRQSTVARPLSATIPSSHFARRVSPIALYITSRPSLFQCRQLTRTSALHIPPRISTIAVTSPVRTKDQPRPRMLVRMDDSGLTTSVGASISDI